MIRYTLKAAESLIHTEWTLTEFAPGETPERWHAVSLGVADALQWADAQLGQGVELDWKSTDGDAMGLSWTAERAESGDEDGDVEALA